MVKVTVSAKVSNETAEQINDTGFSISDVMVAGVEIFLNLSPEEQKELIWEQRQRKRRERVFTKYNMKNEEN